MKEQTDLLKTTIDDDGNINKNMLEEWTRYMFVVDPIAAYVRDFCKSKNVSEDIMFQLICVCKSI